MSPKTENVGSQYKVSINLGSRLLEMVYRPAFTCLNSFEVDYYILKGTEVLRKNIIEKP